MDGTASADVFENAARFETDLTDRQREVLRLIAAGKTNGEIAETLDMTLAGAKWHVSELLTKLALDSREAAAAYYRWRQAPHRRLAGRLQALASTTALKVGLASAAGVGVVAVGVAAYVAFNGDDSLVGPAEPGLPFYMETIFTRTEEHYSYDADRRYWYQDSTHTREELESPVITRRDPGFEIDFGSSTGYSTVIRNGDTRWRGDSKTYQDEDVSRLAYAGLEGTSLGPLPDATVDDFIARYTAEGGSTLLGGEPSVPLVVNRLKSEKVLGVPVQVIEFRVVDSSGIERGWRRYWIDPDRMLVLRHDSHVASTADAGSINLTQSEKAVKLTYGSDLPADAFVFTPVAGSSPIICRTLRPNDQTALGLLFPSPFWRLATTISGRSVFPAEWGVSVFTDGTCDTASAALAEPAPNGPGPGPILVRIRQEAHSVGSVFPSASEEVNLGDGFTVQLGDADAGGRSVAWSTGEVGIEVQSEVLSDDELIEFARAMVAANQ
ncbi:MAG: LuxR C-terminal-related transcriptional regulator [Dehalococcoidia bacterium]